jgi:hypothetical protein
MHGQSEEDISLAVFQLEQRYTKYLQSIEKRLDGTAADATATTNRNLELYEMAVELAKKIFNLKCK